MTKQYNVNIIGDLTNDNGVLSGFSVNNYATLPETLENLTINSLEIVFKFKTNSLQSNNAIFWTDKLIEAPSIPWAGLRLCNYSVDGWVFDLEVTDNNTQVAEIYDSTPITLDTYYYIKALYDKDDGYSLSKSEDGENYTLIGTNATTDMPSNLQAIIGRAVDTDPMPLDGSIDLNESYIKVNGSIWWRGVENITKIQLRHDTAANWTSVNPILLDGEVGIETDTRKQKFGDGVTAWNSLPYDKGSTAVQSSELNDYQEKLVSGTNIKTINLESILGEGNIEIDVGDVDQTYDSTSTNAQSGIAVAEAMSEKLSLINSNSVEVSADDFTFTTAGSFNVYCDTDDSSIINYDYGNDSLSFLDSAIGIQEDTTSTNIVGPTQKDVNFVLDTGKKLQVNGDDVATVSQIPPGSIVDQTYNPSSANAQSGVAIGNAGFLTSADLPTNYVTTDTAQTISGRKTFTGEKAIYFKQSATTDKLGFTLYNASDAELGAFEYRPNTINGGALLNVNCSHSSTSYVGFRYWGTAVNIIAPKVATAGNYYIPVNVTNGTNTVTANNTGTLNISSLLPDISTKQDTLVSGTNIKSINNSSILGNGNVNLANTTLSNVLYGVKWVQDSSEQVPYYAWGVETGASTTYVYTLSETPSAGDNVYTIESGDVSWFSYVESYSDNAIVIAEYIFEQNTFGRDASADTTNIDPRVNLYTTYNDLDIRLDLASSVTVDQTYDSTSTNAQSGTAVAEAIANKQNTITSSAMLSSDLVNDTNNTHKFATSAQLAQIGTNRTDIVTINGKIPSQASSSNQLADKAFVNSSIQTATANFRGNWSTWSNVPTSASSYPADYAGSTTPTVNDYLVVQDASDYTGDTLEGTWRFKYTGVWATNGKNGWNPEYQVNETPLTSAQLAALNSGITASKVSEIDTKVSKTGDTMTGLLKLSGSTATANVINLVNTNITSVSTVPSSNSFTTLSFNDTNDSALGDIILRNTTTARELGLRLFSYDGNNQLIRIGCDTNNNFYTQAPAPAASDSISQTNIATTGWVNDASKSTNVVHRSSSETISGNKTFTALVTVNKSGTGYVHKGSDLDFANGVASNTGVNVTQISDTNGNRMGVLAYQQNADGSHNIYINDKKDNSTSTYAQLTVGWDASGNAYASAPTPDSSSNTNHIATTAWTRTLTSSLQTVQAINTSSTTFGTVTITLSTDYSIYRVNPTAATTIVFRNTDISSLSGSAYTFELCIDMRSQVNSIVLPTISWQNGEIPDLSSAGMYFFAIRTLDGGQTWFGNLQGVWQ